MDFFSSPLAGISWEKLASLDNVPQELKDEAKRNCDLHIDLHECSSYPHYCIVQFQMDAEDLRGFFDADKLKAFVLPKLAADNVNPLVVIKKATPTSGFLFLAVCKASKQDAESDSDASDDDIESPKSPAQSRVSSAARSRDA